MAEKEPERKVEPVERQVPASQPVSPSPVQGSGTAFEVVKLTDPVNERDRDPSGATVRTTGRTSTNSAGFVDLDRLVRKLGQDPATFALLYGVSLEKKQIALYPVDGKTAGAVPVRHDAQRMSTTIYLKSLFKQFPSLVPQTRQQCHLFRDVDADGKECLVLALATALDKPKSREKKGGAKA